MREDVREFWRLVQLRNVLNLEDPLDKVLFQKVKNKELSFCFVKERGGK